MGGVVENGRPLPDHIRQKIAKLCDDGLGTIAIAKKLQVSHGCVSKIKKQYKTTGSVSPGIIGGSKPKVMTPKLTQKVREYKRRNPSIYAWNIRDKLLKDRVCRANTLPSISSINRALRSAGLSRDTKDRK